MLQALEAHLVALVDAALAGATTTVAGPWRPSGNGALVVHARSLEQDPPGNDPPTDDPAYTLELVAWPSDGNTLDFEIPANLDGELVEVESPPGYTLRRGDAWLLDTRTIRFYRAPAPGNPGVRARLRGDAAKGFKRRKPCRIELAISAWATTTASADQRLDIALQTSLAALVELPNLEAGVVGGVHVQMRILQPRAWLLRIDRSAPASTNLVESRATLQLRGDLELLVAGGAPQPVGVIEQLAGALRIDRANGEISPPETFEVGLPASPSANMLANMLAPPPPPPPPPPAPAPPPPAGPRPIESKPIDLLNQLGAQTKAEFLALTPSVDTLAMLAALDVDAISAQLANTSLTPIKAREFEQRARMVLEFPAPPPVAPASLSATITSLLVLDVAGLAATLGLDLATADQLLADLMTLQILLKSNARDTLTLGDFSPT